MKYHSIVLLCMDYRYGLMYLTNLSIKYEFFPIGE